MCVEANRAESAREEAEGKIRGSRNPAWGRVGEGGSVGITAVGEAASTDREHRFIFA